MAGIFLVMFLMVVGSIIIEWLLPIGFKDRLGNEVHRVDLKGQKRLVNINISKTHLRSRDIKISQVQRPWDARVAEDGP